MPFDPSRIDPNVLDTQEQARARSALWADVERRTHRANLSVRQQWQDVASLEDWQGFARPKIEALRASLGTFPDPPDPLPVTVARTIDADGYAIECLAYESRPGVPVTADLYRPVSGANDIGFVLVHSHHNPRVQGELQDMGAIWARAGCTVLVIDQLGYGERRWHEPGPREDYYFRYHTGAQLSLLGDSLMGWMVYDIHRGIDLLVNDRGIRRVVLMGSVAGGGDPCGVAAALDERVTCAIPFNFGGPQPETVYPLPADAETSFNEMGRGGWETTRNLARSGREGFLPWVIVASIAPRHLVYAHEFAWDWSRDPVWRRLKQVYALHGVPERLGYAHGFGLLSGRPPQASHCNNVGPPHRAHIHRCLERWFDLPVPDDGSEIDRREASDMRALEDGRRAPALHGLWLDLAEQRLETVRGAWAALDPEERRGRLRARWSEVLGTVDPGEVTVSSPRRDTVNGVNTERTTMHVEGIPVPLLTLSPPEASRGTVIGIARSGKAGFLAHRSSDISALLHAGYRVCLPDLRGCGESSLGGARYPRGPATSLAATLLMFGETLLGGQLRDLRALIRQLREETGTGPIALWGDAFVRTNPPDLVDPPVNGAPPRHAEPAGGVLALLGALFEPQIAAVLARATVPGFRSLLRGSHVYVPADAIVPDAVEAGDLDTIVHALAPTPVQFEAPVDGRNIPIQVDTPERLDLPADGVSATLSSPSRWFDTVIPRT